MSGFRPEILALEAYSLREAPLPVKLDQNEAPWDWPEALKKEASALVGSLAFNRYPPFDERELTAALSGRWGHPAEGILVANGSNGILQALFAATGGPGRRALLPSPSFGLYRQMALLSGTEPLEVPLREAVAYDPERWIEEVRRVRPELVLICSPNNPTGASFLRPALEALLVVAPGVIAVDEAYGEFAGDSAVGLIPRFPNLVVLRTFSKAWGGAALRLGYALASAEAATSLSKALLPYAVSPLAAGLGLIALRHADLFEGRVGLVLSERDRLARSLAETPDLTVYPSDANFLLVRIAGRPATEVHSALKVHGILVRDVSRAPGLSGCLRITVGSPAENDAVVGALREALVQTGAPADGQEPFHRRGAEAAEKGLR